MISSNASYNGFTISVENLSCISYDKVNVLLTSHNFDATYSKITLDTSSKYGIITKTIHPFDDEMPTSSVVFDPNNYNTRDFSIFVCCSPLSCKNKVIHKEKNHICKTYHIRPVTIYESPPYTDEKQKWSIAIPNIMISIIDKKKLIYSDELCEDEYVNQPSYAKYEKCVGQKIIISCDFSNISSQ